MLSLMPGSEWGRRSGLMRETLGESSMETQNLSKSQIDRLGERLKAGPISEADLNLLDSYRRSFKDPYETVFSLLCEEMRRQKLDVEPTGRVAKTIPSIVEKLRRESIRLTQIQDIAGCRVVVDNIVTQDRLVESLINPRRIRAISLSGEHDNSVAPPLFPDASVVDRRVKPSHGYRAVHVIVKITGKPVEIQIRSRLQHLWAEFCEKNADVIDPSIKYGGGNDFIQSFLIESSKRIKVIEELERLLEDVNILNYRRHVERGDVTGSLGIPSDIWETKEELDEASRNLMLAKENLISDFNEYNKILFGQ